jgi:hypothetical protein
MKAITSILLCIIAIAIYHRNNILERIATFTNHTASMSAPTTTQDSTHSSSTAFPGLPVVPPSDPSLNAASNMSIPRTIRQSFLAVSQSEGAGARVRRSIGTPKLRNLSRMYTWFLSCCEQALTDYNSVSHARSLFNPARRRFPRSPP